MSGHKHTPGPWHRGCEGSEVIQIVTVDESDNLQLCIATVYKWVALNPKTQDSEEARANAYLIAAAPELLAALESVLEHADFMGGRAQIAHTRAKAAIAKATRGGL